MEKADKHGTVTLEELIVSSLAQTDAVAKLLIEKGVFTQDDFMEKIKAPCFPSKINTITVSHGLPPFLPFAIYSMFLLPFLFCLKNQFYYLLLIV